MLAFVTGVALLVLALMFSMLVLAAVAVVGLLVSAYLWWKTRALRRHIREQMNDAANQSGPWTQATEGTVIEGEIIAAEVERGESDVPPRR